MGNSTSVHICQNPECGTPEFPLLPLGVALLIIILFPIFLYWPRHQEGVVVSISMTWRMHMVYTIQWCIMVPMLVYYSICLQGAILGILWTGAVLLFMVATFNPEPTNTLHQVSALLLFLYMTCIGGWIAFDVYQELQGASFAFALVAYILMCMCFVAIFVSAAIVKIWEGWTSLYEIFFCVLFIILLIPVNSGRVC
jgi:hypothetical protein